MPTASVGAPPAREMIVPSPMLCAVCVSISGVTTKPQLLTFAATSTALVPIRVGAAPEAFGLLVLGSPDPTRFTAEMGTTYLARIGEIASAALSRLLK